MDGAEGCVHEGVGEGEAGCGAEIEVREDLEQDVVGERGYCCARTPCLWGV